MIDLERQIRDYYESVVVPVTDDDLARMEFSPSRRTVRRLLVVVAAAVVMLILVGGPLWFFGRDEPATPVTEPPADPEPQAVTTVTAPPTIVIVAPDVEPVVDVWALTERLYERPAPRAVSHAAVVIGELLYAEYGGRLEPEGLVGTITPVSPTEWFLSGITLMRSSWEDGQMPEPVGTVPEIPDRWEQEATFPRYEVMVSIDGDPWVLVTSHEAERSGHRTMRRSCLDAFRWNGSQWFTVPCEQIPKDPDAVHVGFGALPGPDGALWIENATWPEAETQARIHRIVDRDVQTFDPPDYWPAYWRFTTAARTLEDYVPALTGAVAPADGSLWFAADDLIPDVSALVRLRQGSWTEFTEFGPYTFLGGDELWGVAADGTAWVLVVDDPLHEGRWPRHTTDPVEQWLMAYDGSSWLRAWRADGCYNFSGKPGPYGSACLLSVAPDGTVWLYDPHADMDGEPPGIYRIVLSGN